MGGIGAICLSIAAIVFGVIALVRCRHQHDALAKAGGIIGIGAVMLFWSFCALLFALSAMYF